jgi:hypothetical protein
MWIYGTGQHSEMRANHNAQRGRYTTLGKRSLIGRGTFIVMSRGALLDIS